LANVKAKNKDFLKKVLSIENYDWPNMKFTNA